MRSENARENSQLDNVALTWLRALFQERVLSTGKGTSRPSITVGRTKDAIRRRGIRKRIQNSNCCAASKPAGTGLGLRTWTPAWPAHVPCLWRTYIDFGDFKRIDIYLFVI